MLALYVEKARFAINAVIAFIKKCVYGMSAEPPIVLTRYRGIRLGKGRLVLEQ